ncbi:sodium/hydrogen exchanger [hydrocarbon metagenome]|uniref:Sodium/hydrogen exchanger n=1 Tax=hydrocarbon metagenome TaxID=938273 RepID=A0A0W8FJK4_9ZZZZ
MFLAFAVALTLFALGTVRLLGSEDLLAVFAAGLALDYVLSAGERTEEENIVEAINSFFTLPIFTLIGLVLPWGAWLRIGWAGVLLAVAVLLLRRLPILALVRTRIGGLHSGADVLFLEWFGPTGVAALYYASYSLPITGLEEVWIVGSLILSISIVLHGLSSTPFALWYGRRAQASG